MKNPSFHPTLNRLLAGCGVTPRHVRFLDSSTLLLAALAAFLRGEDFVIGPRGRLTRAAAQAARCALPDRTRSWAHRMGTWADAVPPPALSAFRSETTARWVTAQFPRRRYPVVLLGASNGAATHLASALHAPWLPQTLLVLVRTSGVDPLQSPLAAGHAVAHSLLAAAPDLQVHQMPAPVADRTTKGDLLHFRLKRLELGPAYERFLLEHLEPGGTLAIVDCRCPRPCVEVGERHYFQLGGVGAPKDEAQAHPAGRTAHGDARARADGEWGYDPQLTSDVIRFADRHGYRVERLSFQEPEDLSPWVADLYRERILSGCGAPDRLVIESSALTDPWCMRRTGSVPFWVPSWTNGGGRGALPAVERYLEGTRSFEEICAVLKPGARLPKHARNPHGPPPGVDLRYHDGWARLPDAPRAPRPLSWSELRAYASDGGESSPVLLELLHE